MACAIARAGRARIAYEAVFPEEGDSELVELFSVLVREADADSPEACANYWYLVQGLPDERRGAVAVRPARVVEMTDFSGAEFDGLDFDQSFSANLAVFVGARFTSCTFTGCQFTQCDFTGASFSACRFEKVGFENCDGPVRFDGCPEIIRTTFREVHGRSLPAWEFVDCEFGPETRIAQRGDRWHWTEYAPLVRFSECFVRDERNVLLTGPELGQHPKQVTGLDPVGDTDTDPAVACLRRLLRTFFPSRFGDGGAPPARDYIRASAIGRGAYPPGSPGSTELTSFLEAEGFNSGGGRENHLYAPWSEVGGTARSELRSEFSAFVQNSATQGPTVKKLLDKIRIAANW